LACNGIRPGRVTEPIIGVQVGIPVFFKHAPVQGVAARARHQLKLP
jgi:hypothetical protein